MGSRGWKRVGLGLETGRFRVGNGIQGVEMGRFRAGHGIQMA